MASVLFNTPVLECLTKLLNADLRGARIIGADFTGANLQKIKLKGADISDMHVLRGTGKKLGVTKAAISRRNQKNWTHCEGVGAPPADDGTWCLAHQAPAEIVGCTEEP